MKNDEMKFYKIVSEDLIEKHKEDFANLLLRVYETNFADVHFSESFINKEILRIVSYISDGSALVYVCAHDNHIVGMIWAYVRELFTGKELHIPILVVNDAYERKGISSQLMSLIKNEALENGICKITLLVSSDNNSALSFYEKKGFLEKRKYLECEVQNNDN